MLSSERKAGDWIERWMRDASLQQKGTATKELTSILNENEKDYIENILFARKNARDDALREAAAVCAKLQNEMKPLFDQHQDAIHKATGMGYCASQIRKLIWGKNGSTTTRNKN